jgi:GT2 family glycosyltransferase
MKTVAIVVAYNSSRDLPMSLGSLCDLPLAASVVVDNSSTDASVEVAARYTSNIIQLPNVGFGKAINAAVGQFPEADRYLLLNPDSSIGPDAFNTLSRALDDDPTVGVAAPRMVYPDGRTGISAGPEMSILKEWLGALRVDHMVPARFKRTLAGSRVLRSRIRMLDYLDDRQSDGVKDVAWVSGFCMLIRAEAFRGIGGFDPSFFLYFEDVDLCRRLRAAHWRVVSVPSASAQHLESTSTRAVGKNALYRAGLVTYCDKHGSRTDRLLARALKGFPL